MQIKQPAPTHDESLSFDLMTALAGDDVEFKGVNGWESINAHRLSKEMILTGYYKNMNLRMKHPQLEIL